MPSHAHLTPDAKAALSKTIRDLRVRLLREIREHADGVYRLSIKEAEQAGLTEAARRRRDRLERWLDEQVRGVPAKEQKKARERFLDQAVKEAAHTLVNRLVVIRHLEALGLSKPAVVTGGWKSLGYRELRDFAPALCDDETEGYAPLLTLLFDELAQELPGLFGDVGLTRLFPIPAPTLRAVIEALDSSVLESAWTDDTTLGWVYQYWNDPEREALDAKLNAGGKVEPHEIAAKTQMFTERYMVEWLLHNSLGATWLCMCRKNGWMAEAETVLPVLEARRAEWRGKRERGEVALDALMAIEGEVEARWKYYVPQPLPQAAIDAAPGSIRDLKLLDPACGSGHFLIIAFDLLAALYREEARHAKQDWSDRQIAEWILEDNLYGVDIDPRAIQIAAAGLYLKAKARHRAARPKRLNLVAPDLKLAALPQNDPAFVALRREVHKESGIPEELTNTIVSALKGADHLGSLLKVDAAIEDAIRGHEQRLIGQRAFLFDGSEKAPASPRAYTPLFVFSDAKATIHDALERFLEAHSAEEDLGLRLDGEQLAAGVRFVRMMREGTYDVLVGNPPYQGTNRMADSAYVTKMYPRGKADLFAAFLERGLELVRACGLSAMVTMKGWMFIDQFTQIREHLLKADVRLIGDVGWGAFAEMTDNPVVLSVLCARSPKESSVSLCPTHPTARVRTDEHYRATVAGLLAQAGRYEFNTKALEAIEGEPIVYWWSEEFLAKYAATPKLGNVSPGRFGLTTGDNTRFVRFWYEVPRWSALRAPWGTPIEELRDREWVPFVLGGKGRAWVEPIRDVCRWRSNGLEVKEKCVSQYGTISKQVRNEDAYFMPGIAFAMIGTTFSGRVHRCPSVIGNMGSSVYPDGDLAPTLALMNTATAKFILQSINPGVHFEVGDVNRLPVFPVPDAQALVARVIAACAEQEATRESSIEFCRPGPSAWNYAQVWAQVAIDRSAGEPLPPYEQVYDPPALEAAFSFAFGVAMGRFGANGEGILDKPPTSALPGGILFVSSASDADSLTDLAAAPIVEAWKERPADMTAVADLGEYLRKHFFASWIKSTYENRPVYLPLSSAKRSFVAWVSIHCWNRRWGDKGTWGDGGRWGDGALQTLLADHLHPERKTLEGQLEDLRRARTAGEKKDRAGAEKRFAEIQKLHEELVAFIDAVSTCAEKGPPSPDATTPPREVDARYQPDLDDGVMVNSAALWPLLEPQWKDPKKWWKELATGQGRKDYDWSHLAARYFPTRVLAKCKEDPSLAVAHGCFWKYHPAKAFAWELRLKDEIRPDFTIDEEGSNDARQRFLAERPEEAEALETAEAKRRERKAAKGRDEEEDQGTLPFAGADSSENADGVVDAETSVAS